MIKFLKIQPVNTNSLKGKSPLDINTELNKMLNTIKMRAEAMMSDKNYYNPINEYFQNTDKKLYCKSAALTISQDEADKAQHLLEVSILHPAMVLENKRPLACGTKNDILEFLKSPNALNIIKTDIEQMSDKFKNM